MTEGLLTGESKCDLFDEGNPILGDFRTPGPWIVSFAVPKLPSTLAFRRPHWVVLFKKDLDIRRTQQHALGRQGYAMDTSYSWYGSQWMIIFFWLGSGALT